MLLVLNKEDTGWTPFSQHLQASCMLAVWGKGKTATAEMDFEIQINKTSDLNARRVWRPVHNWVREHGWIISLETVWIQAQNLIFILAVYGSWESVPRPVTLLGLALLLSHSSRVGNLPPFLFLEKGLFPHHPLQDFSRGQETSSIPKTGSSRVSMDDVLILLQSTEKLIIFSNILISDKALCD